jgi:hypothetical protein
LGNNAASDIERQDFVKNFYYWKTEPEQKSEQKLFQSVHQNHNKSLRFHNTATDLASNFFLILVPSQNGTGTYFFFIFFFGGLECVGHSFAYVAHF